MTKLPCLTCWEWEHAAAQEETVWCNVLEISTSQDSNHEVKGFDWRCCNILYNSVNSQMSGQCKPSGSPLIFNSMSLWSQFYWFPCCFSKWMNKQYEAAWYCDFIKAFRLWHFSSMFYNLRKWHYVEVCHLFWIWSVLCLCLIEGC